MCIDDWVYFLRCRANSRKCLRRCLAFGYVARCCSRRNARLSCGADNGGRNTSPHTISPFTPFNSVLLRSGAFRFLKPDCVAWLLSNNRKKAVAILFRGFATAPSPTSIYPPLTTSNKGRESVLCVSVGWRRLVLGFRLLRWYLRRYRLRVRGR